MNVGGNRWVLFRSVGYMVGKGITFGQGILPPIATNGQVYSIVVDTIKAGQAVQDSRLEVFAPESLDHVFVGKRLASLDSPENFLREATSKLKIGGHLLIFSTVGPVEPGLKEFYPHELSNIIKDLAKWQLKGEWIQEGQSLQIFKKIKGKKGIEAIKSKPTQPTACVARYGALGDGIIMSPLLRQLKKDGYHVTLNASTYGLDVFKHNPNVDNLIIQERDAIPNQELGNYWDFWATQYDKYVNLSESIEGDLLKVEGRKEFFTSKKWRNDTCGSINYYDYTFKRAGYGEETYGQNGELFFTDAEDRRAKEFFAKYKDKFVIVWALNGSSHHKVYPLMEAVLLELFKQYKDMVCVTVGDTVAKLLEFDHPQLITKAAEWKIRESLIATKYANLVVGPETMITNASGCFDTPKITFLSHSNHTNLCKHWKNDFCLEPNQAISPCYPCHQLKYNKDACPIGSVVDTITDVIIGNAPLCAVSIEPGRVMEQIGNLYDCWKEKRTPQQTDRIARPEIWQARS